MKKILSIVLMSTVLAVLFGGCGATSEKPVDTAKVTEASAAVNDKGYYDIKIDVPTPMDAVKVMPVKKKSDIKTRIAILGYQNNPYWVVMKNGGMAAKKVLEEDIKGAIVDWVVVAENIDVPKMIAAIETAIAKKYDGIVLPVIDDGIIPSLQKAMDAGITVSTFVCESDGCKKTNRLALFGQDVLKGGEVAGETLDKLMESKGKLGIITGAFGVVSFEQRINGAKSKLGKDIQIVGTYENQDKADKAYTITKDMLTANPDLKAIYVVGGGPHGAARALEEMGLKGKVKLVSFDATPENLDYVRKGIISATIADSAFAQIFDATISTYNFIVAGERPASKEMWTDMKAITPENVDQLVGATAK